MIQCIDRESPVVQQFEIVLHLLLGVQRHSNKLIALSAPKTTRVAWATACETLPALQLKLSTEPAHHCGGRPDPVDIEPTQ